MQLEQFHTTKGNPIGGHEKLVDDPFGEWKKSERTKYEKYLSKLRITGNNQSGRKLKPGAKPDEIYPIDVWREEEKRTNAYEPTNSKFSSSRICKKEDEREFQNLQNKFFH